jgi:hypothetical protein
MQVNQISSDEVQRMRERAQPAIQQVINTVGQPLFDQVQAELAKVPE